MTDDGQRVITIAYPELCSGVLTNEQTTEHEQVAKQELQNNIKNKQYQNHCLRTFCGLKKTVGFKLVLQDPNLVLGSDIIENINKRTMMVLYRSPEQTDLHTYC